MALRCRSDCGFFHPSYVVVMPKKRQALVEFEDILGACNAVNYAADNQIYIAGHPAFVNYSTSQKISRPGDTDDSRGVNNVLLFTILNPIYSITTVGDALGGPEGFGNVEPGMRLCPGPGMCYFSGAQGGSGAPPLCLSQIPHPFLPLLSRRMCSTPSATPVAPCRGSLFSGKTASRPWWNILLCLESLGLPFLCFFCCGLVRLCCRLVASAALWCVLPSYGEGAEGFPNYLCAQGVMPDTRCSQIHSPRQRNPP